VRERRFAWCSTLPAGVLQSSLTTHWQRRGFSARLEAVVFPGSCSVEHALVPRKWQSGMRGGWLPSSGVPQLLWAGFVTAPCAPPR